VFVSKPVPRSLEVFPEPAKGELASAARVPFEFVRGEGETAAFGAATAGGEGAETCQNGAVKVSVCSGSVANAASLTGKSFVSRMGRTEFG
jgi:hypothetical protein